MVQRARYFDTVNYTEAEYAEVQNRLLPEGVIRGIASELGASAPGGMIVRIGPGEGMIQGFWYKNDTNVDVPIPANNSGSTRTDNIVLRLNRTSDTVSLVHVPNGPAPTRSVGGTWEMILVSVAVPNGAGAIVPANLTDQRPGDYCGYTGGGAAPDGVAAQPGMAFAGNRTTGFWRNTPGGATGGVRLSINAIPHFFWDTTGFTFATGGPAPAGVALFHTYGHPGTWMQTVPNSGHGGILFGNHYDYNQQTKRVYLGYGTAASQYLGHDGDLSIYTSGTAAGKVILGNADGIRMIIGRPQVSVGPVAGTGALNVFSYGNGASTGFKLYHSNQAHHLDMWQNSDATVYMTNVDHLGNRAPNSLSFHAGTGYMTLGANADALSKFTVLQVSEAADQGFGIRYAGGYMRQYVMGSGDFIITSYSTATRHWHSANAFTPYTSDNCYLGLSNYRWYMVYAANGMIGGCNLNASGLDPLSNDAYHIGSTYRWHTIRSLVMNANSSMNTPMLYLDQGAPNTGGGVRFNYGGVVSNIFQDASGHMNIHGPGTTARCHLLLMNNQGILRPASNGQVELGQNGVGFSNLWLTGNIYGAGMQLSGGITVGNVIYGTGLSLSGGMDITAAVVFRNALNVTGPTTLGGLTTLSGAVNVGGILSGGQDIVTNSAVRPITANAGAVGTTSNPWGVVNALSGNKTNGGSWGVLSDDRTKVAEAFRPYESGLSIILQLRPTWFTYNGLYGTPEGMEYAGLRADEAREIAPDLVRTVHARAHGDQEDEPEEELLVLDASNLPIMLINAVKELHGRIEALEAALAERRN